MDALGFGKAIDLVRDMMAPVGGTLSEGWAALVGDRVSFWRAKNALRYRPLLVEEAGRLGLKINAAKVPDKFAFTWFEEATKQDEPELQILFARLLARAADDASEAIADRRLIDVLARLTPQDALLFQRLYSEQPFPETGTYSDTLGLGKGSDRAYPLNWLTSLLEKVHPNYSPISLDNLVVQGCIERQRRIEIGRSHQKAAISYNSPDRQLQEELEKNLPRMVKQREYIDGTALGLSLYNAVRE